MFGNKLGGSQASKGKTIFENNYWSDWVLILMGL